MSKPEQRLAMPPEFYRALIDLVERGQARGDSAATIAGDAYRLGQRHTFQIVADYVAGERE